MATTARRLSTSAVVRTFKVAPELMYATAARARAATATTTRLDRRAKSRVTPTPPTVERQRSERRRARLSQYERQVRTRGRLPRAAGGGGQGRCDGRLVAKATGVQDKVVVGSQVPVVAVDLLDVSGPVLVGLLEAP